MQFIVVRTSESDDEKRPCENAHKGKFLYADVRTVSDPKELGAVGMDWYDRGFNHGKTTDGKIVRFFEYDGWMINVYSLSDLLTLVRNEGHEVIIQPTDCITEFGDPLYQLEIYDDYRE